MKTVTIKSKGKEYRLNGSKAATVSRGANRSLSKASRVKGAKVFSSSSSSSASKSKKGKGKGK